MSIQSPSKLSLRLRHARKREIRTQFAVLAYRMVPKKSGMKCEVCIITSRGTGRWIIPKGWPMSGLSPAAAVKREAFEEAGIKGKVHPQSLGLFSYDKKMGKMSLPVIAVIYIMEVSKILSKWPESSQRKRKWLSPKKAAQKLSDKELARIVANFDPANLPE